LLLLLLHPSLVSSFSHWGHLHGSAWAFSGSTHLAREHYDSETVVFCGFTGFPSFPRLGATYTEIEQGPFPITVFRP
jgi:hypothetical protein